MHKTFSIESLDHHSPGRKEQAESFSGNDRFSLREGKSMDSGRERRKVVFLLNTVAPGRIPILEYLSESFEVSVLTGRKESNRDWDLPASSHFVTQQAW